jgi:capsular exopolysaccharide synthesis family protein
MNNPNLPVGPLGEDPMQLPARHDAQQGIAPRHGDAVLDLLREGHKDNSDEIDLLAYWRMLVKRRWLVLSVVAACTVVALVMTLMATPMYRATAVVKIDNVSSQMVQIGEISAPWAGGWDPEFLTTQIGVLTSRSLAERVAEDLQLDRAALGKLRPPSWLERLKSTVRPNAEAATEAAQPASDAKMAAADLAAGAGTIMGGLSVEPQLNSKLVNISYSSAMPQFAARVANAVADGYIAAELERAYGANAYAKKYLEDQLQETKAKLEQSERALVEFALKENLVNVGEGQSLAGQNLGTINTSLAEAQAQRIRAQARWTQLQANDSLPQDLLGSSLVPALRQQRADLHRQYQEKLQVFKPDYPDMQKLKSQIEEMDRQIGAEIGNVRRSVRAEYDAALAQEELLKGQLASLRTESLDTDNRSIQYNILRREADTSRQLYDSLLQRYKMVGAASDIRPNNIAVIDRAQVPGGAYSPNSMTNLAIGLFVGLLLGVALALLLEFMDDTLKTPEDVEQKLRMPVLGIIPKLGAKQSVAEATKDLRSAFSEAYRSVRTALQFSTDHGVPRVLLLTSAVPGEGKSTSALALARNFAQLGKRVLLIEADMRNPSLHRSLSLRGDKGLSNLLAGAASLQEVVIDGGDERLEVILSGPLPPNPAELLSGSRLVSLLSIAAQHYDQVVIDGPPVMGIADGPLLASSADATMLVVDSGRTKISNAQAALKRLLATRSHVIGVLLTKYDAKAAGYGYQYEGYYAYGGPARLPGKKR